MAETSVANLGVGDCASSLAQEVRRQGDGQNADFAHGRAQVDSDAYRGSGEMRAKPLSHTPAKETEGGFQSSRRAPQSVPLISPPLSKHVGEKKRP